MAAIRAVISLLEEVVYPRRDYGDRACRAGAELLNKLFGIDTLDALTAYYVPGAEELAVRAALQELYEDVDPRLVAKTAAVMAAHAARLAPYADALEVFSLLQGMDVPLGCIVDGPAHSQRQLADRLQADKIFQQIVFSGELYGDHPLTEGLHLMELLLDCPLSSTAFLCSRGEHARAAAPQVGQVYRIIREAPSGRRQSGRAALSNVIPMVNLYDLPEALGLVAWPDV